MAPVSPSSPTTLELVKEKFAHWRATREKRGRIPEALWELVVPLAHQYTNTEISSVLKLNHSQLIKQLQQFPSSQKEVTPFVDCSLAMRAPETSNPILEFIFKNDTSVKISGITTAEMMPILSILMGS